MKQDKFLMGIIIGIIALVAIALVVFFTRQNITQEYQAEDQPTGVVFNYILALHKGDYDKAYGYLSDADGKPTMAKFRQGILINKPQMEMNPVDVTGETVDGNSATVMVATTYSGGGVFNEGSRNTENASLEKEAGKWKLISMPYTYWSYDWYQPVIKQ